VDDSKWNGVDGDNQKRKGEHKMKNTKENHYIAELQEQQGEYEHTTKYLFKTAGDPFEYAEKQAKTWYGDEDAEKDEYSNGYWQNGEILSSVGEVKKISLEHYNVLKKYLSVL
jgi:hypothetical protein